MNLAHQRFSRRGLGILFFGAFTLAGVSAEAATVSYQQGISPSADYQSADGTIRSDNASNNYGAGIYNIVGRVPGGILRTVLSYDLTGIPADAIITSVTLTIRGERNDANSSDAALVYNLHRLQGTFTEGTGGLNGAANAGVSWNSRGGSAWTTAGGDFNPTVLSSISVNSTSADELTYTFNSTSELVAAAQDALTNGGTLGLLMKLNGDDEGEAVRNVFFFHADDVTGTDNSEINKRPILTVTYIPEPSAMACMAMGGLLLLGKRRRE